MTHLLPFYKTLKFTDTTASLSDVKKRYRQLALLFHPDKATSDEEKKAFPTAFGELTEAYDIIVKHLGKKTETASSASASASTTTTSTHSTERKRDAKPKDKANAKSKATGNQQQQKQQFYDHVFGNGQHKNVNGTKTDSKTSDIREAYAKFMGSEASSNGIKPSASMGGPLPMRHASTPSQYSSSPFVSNLYFNSASGSGPPPSSTTHSFPYPFMSPRFFADSDPLSSRHAHSNGNSTTHGSPSLSSSSQDKKTGYERNTKRETYRIMELSLRDFNCGAMRKIPSNKGARCRICFSESEPIAICMACNGRGPRCSGCEGSGTKKGWQFSICNHCSGQGKMISCTRCNNRGYCLGNCVKCGNTRGVPAPESITISIVPGKHFPGTIIRLVDGPQSSVLSSGTFSPVRDIVLRLVNMGDLLEGGTVFGDGIPRPIFKAVGPLVSGDLSCSLPIQLNGILLGCQLEFRHLNGNIFRVNTPEGHIMSPSECLVMEGQGIPRPGGGRGRLYIALKWQMPTPGDVELMRESLQHLLPTVSKPRDRNGVIATVRPELPLAEPVETTIGEREIVIDVSSS